MQVKLKGSVREVAKSNAKGPSGKNLPCMTVSSVTGSRPFGANLEAAALGTA